MIVSYDGILTNDHLDGRRVIYRYTIPSAGFKIRHPLNGLLYLFRTKLCKLFGEFYRCYEWNKEGKLIV